MGNSNKNKIKDEITACNFSNNGEEIIVGSLNNQIRIYD